MKKKRELRNYLDGKTKPFISCINVKLDKPTVLEFATQSCKEANDKYAVNDKCQLIINDTRYSLAIVFKDEKDRYVLIGRETIAKNKMANQNNRAAELARLEGLDFPLASRGVLPDSSFEVKDSLNDATIQRIELIGIAEERPGLDLNAKDDAFLVMMPCYEATISSKDLDKTAGNNGRILTVKEILELDPKQCSAKVLELQKHLNLKAQKKA